MQIAQFWLTFARSPLNRNRSGRDNGTSAQFRDILRLNFSSGGGFMNKLIAIAVLLRPRRLCFCRPAVPSSIGPVCGHCHVGDPRSLIGGMSGGGRWYGRRRRRHGWSGRWYGRQGPGEWAAAPEGWAAVPEGWVAVILVWRLCSAAQHGSRAIADRSSVNRSGKSDNYTYQCITPAGRCSFVAPAACARTRSTAVQVARAAAGGARGESNSLDAQLGTAVAKPECAAMFIRRR